jgi:hypothetical protein
MSKRNTHFRTQAVRHIADARRKFDALQPENPNRLDETAAIRERLIKIEALLQCLGGHATSFDPRLKSLGLTPGKPLPPIDIMVVHTPGPGMPLTFHS